MKNLFKSKFQRRLEEVQKKHQEMSPVSQKGSSQSAQPPNPNGDLNWKHVSDELPQYYSPVHIWDGKTLHRNWSRVWSESVGNVYVNNQDNRVITKITHWTAPEGMKYPKYEPLTSDDIKRYTRRDIKLIIEAMYKLIEKREKSKLPSIDYVAGVDDAIVTLEVLTKPRRMTPKDLQMAKKKPRT